MKTYNNTENRNGMAHVIAYAAELLNNGATVESLSKHGYQFREIRKGCEYVCLCASDFARAAAIAADMESNGESTKTTKEKRTSRAAHIWARLAALFSILNNYAARTLAAIKQKTAALTSAAALLLARVLFMAAGFASGLAVMFAAAVILPEITPDGFASALLLRLPALLAAVGLWAIAYTWTVNRAMPDSLRRYIMDGHR